jgi:hypothetical protein
MRVGELYPSKYFKAADIPPGREMRLTIREIVQEEMGDDEEEKPVVYFLNERRGLVLNRTNADAIAEVYGEETDDWEGKPVILFPATTRFGTKRVDCLRVKIPASVDAANAELDAAAEEAFN